ncbi:MAG: hypothetical protein EXS37_18185 [Opitutus sp.]|nr:hypothetical protein [Opitutus sp.]
MKRLLPLLAFIGSFLSVRAAETVAFFPFDEPVGLYPSSVIADHSATNLPLIIGPGGSIVPGKFGNAFSTAAQPPVNYPAGSVLFGLTPAPTPPGRTVEPLHWRNARFAALLTAGEKHLSKEVQAPNPAATGLNLGAFDWMYAYNSDVYHSGAKAKKERRGIFRTVQRADRFVAAESPYDREATLISRPLIFSGKRLVLNVDTHASGWLQVGFRKPDGSPIPGFGLDECVYVNGNELRYAVEWLPHGKDVSALAGQTVQLVVRMRGASVFALQFTP